jgi:CO/xanthine dehydrogenase Mo-binding subunit
MVSYASVGQAIGHVEGPEKVTGSAHYTADVTLPGMLWGKCLRSPYPHARIVSIEMSRAARLPGVHAVITAADIPPTRIGRFYLDLPVLAADRARFQGEKVAAVAAETPEIAEEALALIDVVYEELPAVFDAVEAMAAHAPRVHDNPASYRHLPIRDFLHGAKAEHRLFPDIPNVISQIRFRHGDVEGAFAQAHRVFEHSFSVPSVHHGYIEPHACAIRIGADGMVDVWLSNKTPFIARSQLADATGLPEERIRLQPVFIGGDFGGKGSLMDAAVCYHLAQRTGRPVKMVMTYTEELMAGNPRHIAQITLRSAVDDQGRILGRRARVVFNSGAYGAFIPLHTLYGGVHVGGTYRVPALEIDSRLVYTNTVPTGHMRAPGAPQVIFAVESHIDMMAHEMGIDPLEFRLRNVLAEGDRSPLGERFHDIRCRETLEAAARAAGWGTPKPPYVGRGIGMYERTPGGGDSLATLSIDSNAQITLLTGLPETGTGAHTILAQIVAEEFKVPLSQVRLIEGSTEETGYDTGAGASRVTHTVGQAVVAAAKALQEALADVAGKMLESPRGAVRFEDGAFIADTGERLELRSLMSRASEYTAVPIVRDGRYAFGGAPAVTCFAAQIAEVEVDPETGQVTLRRLISAHDVGTVINPLTHQGQIEGGVVQGMGQALTEHLMLDEGVVTTLNLGDYKLPTAADIPELTTVLVPAEDGPAPYGGKAIGELSNVAVPAAVANAVFDATGVRLQDLPVTAEKVYRALRDRAG